MKKLLFLFLIFIMSCGNVYSADQWTKTAPQGSANISTADTLLQTNNEATDRLLYNYRENLTVIPDTSAQIKVLVGEIAIQNSAGSIVKWRRNTSTTTITWADIDTGAEASSTQYYVYALGDTDVTTCTFKISTSATSPDGATQYRKIGYFYNDSSSNIVNVGNIKGGDVGNVMQVVGTTDISTTSTTYEDMTDMEIKFVSSGRPVLVLFEAPLENSSVQQWAQIEIDGSGKNSSMRYEHDSSSPQTSKIPLAIHYLDTTLSAGSHTIKIKWKVNTGTGYQKAISDGYRVLTVMEL